MFFKEYFLKQSYAYYFQNLENAFKLLELDILYI